MQNLKDLIKKKGWTDEEAARAFSTHVRNIYHWQNGRIPKKWQLRYICEVLNCTASDVLGY